MTFTRFYLLHRTRFLSQIKECLFIFFSISFTSEGKKAHIIATVNQRIINVNKEAYFIVSDMQNGDLTRLAFEAVEAP